MALIIKPTTEKKIYFQGSSVEINEIYNRINFWSDSNGISMEIGFATYLDKNMYLNQNQIYCDVPTERIVVNINPSSQTQSLQVAHEVAKSWYESLGYDVTIDLT